MMSAVSPNARKSRTIITNDQASRLFAAERLFLGSNCASRRESSVLATRSLFHHLLISLRAGVHRARQIVYLVANGLLAAINRLDRLIA